MQRRDKLTYMILASVVVLGLTLLMVCVDAQARIAFVSDRDGNWEIYVMDADGGNPGRLTNHRGVDSSPSWSPDGKRIAFVSDRDGHLNIRGRSNYEIYVMDADGGSQQNLTNDPNNDSSPSWSPDGKHIVFSSDRDNDRDHNIEIYMMDADGGNQQRLTNNLTEDQYPSWSPDGKRIAFSARREGHVENNFGITYEIYVMDADGGNEQRLTENRNNDWHPVWSPDGRHIVFYSDRDGNFEIYVMDDDGGNPKNLTNHRAWDSSPSWSPDGKHIAFQSWRDRNYEIYVMDADGGNPRNLTNHPFKDTEPSWSPDGRRIVFVSDREADANPDIFVMNADGSNPKNLTNHPEDDLAPAWFGSAFSVASAGKALTLWGAVKQANR